MILADGIGVYTANIGEEAAAVFEAIEERRRSSGGVD